MKNERTYTGYYTYMNDGNHYRVDINQASMRALKAAARKHMMVHYHTADGQYQFTLQADMNTTSRRSSYLSGKYTYRMSI